MAGLTFKIIFFIEKKIGNTFLIANKLTITTADNKKNA